MEIATDDENDVVSTHRVSTDCPLFMEGLPRDFSTNPALAALASLIDEGISSSDNSSKSLCSQKKEDKTLKKRRHSIKNLISKGKLKSSKETCASTTSTEDQVLPPSGPKSSTSIGEASLFLKMWKL
jgi:hypothetical protein